MKRLSKGASDDRLRRMRAGDEEAFVSIYRSHQSGIYRFALHMTGNPAIAEEVTQEVFMALIRDPGRFDSTQGTLSAFLLGIGRNHVLRCLARERGYVALEEEYQGDGDISSGNGTRAQPDVLHELVRQETMERVRESVLSLPAPYREVVVLCDLQEKSYAEAAEILTCAVGTVRSRLSRARSLLLRKLNASGRVHAQENSQVPVNRGDDASDNL
jgi:RNA polymerase sigma-70 factor (ECF subfamily)